MSLINASFVARMLLNLRSERLCRGLLGHTIEQRGERVTAEMAMAFAGATGDDPARYRERGAPAPPLLGARLVLPMFRQLVTHPRLGANLMRMVHGEQCFAWHSPIRIGDRPHLRVSVRSIEVTMAGELLTLAARLYDEQSGDLRGESVSGMLFRARKRKGQPRAKPAPAAPTQPGPEQFRLSVPVSEDQALRYAAASGDDNLIHTNNLFAKAAGLPGVVMQGMCVLGMAASAIINEQLGGDSERLRGLAVRFASFARPGDRLTVLGRASEADTLDLEVRDQRGKAVLTRGQVIVRET